MLQFSAQLFRWRQDGVLVLCALLYFVAGVSCLFTAEPYMAWFILPVAFIPAFLWRRQVLARTCVKCHAERFPLSPDPHHRYEIKYRCSHCGDEVWSGVCQY